MTAAADREQVGERLSERRMRPLPLDVVNVTGSSPAPDTHETIPDGNGHFRGTVGAQNPRSFLGGAAHADGALERRAFHGEIFWRMIDS
jgi:hypothetical protein